MASDVATNPARVDSVAPVRRKRPKRRRVLMIVHEEFVPPEDIGALDDEGVELPEGARLTVSTDDLAPDIDEMSDAEEAEWLESMVECERVRAAEDGAQ